MTTLVPQLGCTFSAVVCRSVERFASREALVCGGQRFTYRQMGERISQYAQALEARGLGRGDALCQLGGNRPEALFVRLAAMLVGMRYTPLHPLGSAEDHAFMANDCEATVLAVDAELAVRGAAIRAGADRLQHVFSIGPSELGEDLAAAADACSPRPLADRSRPGDIAFVVYTGGTTGRPKGIVHRHSSILAVLLMMLAEHEWPRAIRMLVATPLSHAGGSMVPATFARGGTVFLEDAFDPERFLALVERERITVSWLVPTMIYRLLDPPRIQSADVSSLELVIYGASPMSPARLEQALERFGPIFVQIYGQSEAPNTVTTLATTEHDPARPERLASCGHPVLGVEVALLDDDDREVPVGEVGEICVRGPIVMEGYWKRPDETAAALRGGWLHTGDMARRDEDGFLYIVDRKKDMIVSGGFNVYPKEVEDVLAAHPVVAQAAVIGVPDDTWGERVTAIVVRRPGHDVEPAELIAMVRERKGPVQAPKAIEMVDAIPLTPIGKPDKKALRARYWGGQRRQVG